MIQNPTSQHFSIGSVAFLVGVLATFVTAYAVVSRSRKREVEDAAGRYDGWDDSLGV